MHATCLELKLLAEPTCARRIGKVSLNSRFLCSLARKADRDSVRSMRDLLILAIHLLVTVAKFLRPGGARAVAAESLLPKHQLLISNRARQRAPSLTTLDRVVLGLTTLFMSPRRIPKLSAILSSKTLLKLHNALVERNIGSSFPPVPGAENPAPKARPRNLSPQSWR